MKNIKTLHNYHRLLEYQQLIKEFSPREMTKSINSETNLDILKDLLDLITVRMTIQKDITDYYEGDENMKMYPVEVAKENDFETLNYIQSLIITRAKKIESGEVSVDKQIIQSTPKNKTIGYIPKSIENELPKPTANPYKHNAKIGFMASKESIITKFENFKLNEIKKRDVKKEVLKEYSKRKRQERLASGAKLTTKVVPDKKKEYKRQDKKKINLAED
jgi:hypothetical protein